MPTVPLTWLGHSAFRFDTEDGRRVYVDPFLNGNPKCPENEQQPERVDVIALTHGHGDHVGDTVELWRSHEPAIVAQVELRGWLARQGVDESAPAMGANKGGTVDLDGLRITLVNAFHSSSCPDGTYAGEACGLVIQAEGTPTIYVAGDTCVFGDMQLIGRIYRPDVAILPIGGHFTMGPEEAAVALELLGSRRCVPCHYGTFPVLTGTPDALRSLAPGVEVIAPEPGETVEL